MDIQFSLNSYTYVSVPLFLTHKSDLVDCTESWDTAGALYQYTCQTATCMEFLQNRCESADIHFSSLEHVHLLDAL